MLANRLSKRSLYRLWAQGVPMPVVPRPKKIVSRCSTAFRAIRRVCRQLKRTTLHGGRKLGTRPWSLNMLPIGPRLLRAGCRRSWMPMPPMPSHTSCTTKLVVCSRGKRRWLYQASESLSAIAVGSLDPQSRLGGSIRSRGWQS